jgi:hypothetical protein
MTEGFLNVLDFRTIKGAFSRPFDEEITPRIKRLVIDYIKFFLLTPIVLVFIVFLNSPIEFWPLLVEMIRTADLNTLFWFYLILLILTEVFMNFYFTLNLIDIPFFLTSPQLYKKEKRRSEFKESILTFIYGLTRVTIKTLLFVLTSAILINSVEKIGI